MHLLAQDWRQIIVSLGLVASVAVAVPVNAHAKVGHIRAVSAAPSAKVHNATLPTHFVRLKGNDANGFRHLMIRGGTISLQNGVYYHSASKYAFSKGSKARYGLRGRGFQYAYASANAYGGSLQCVPFARAASGIELKGNAANWWDAAAGVYERGNRPEPGSVLNFRATGNMRLGHVAVVSAVIDRREIEIDHANWAGAGAYKAGIARGVHVIDVSNDNDWSEVRVALGSGADYGSTYPTYGFIYDRPDDGMMVANTRRSGVRTISEVAEAPVR